MPTSSSYPRDFFLHLLAIVMLYVSVISGLVLLFQYINILFPDPVEYYSYTGSLDSIRWSTATLLIMFPVFLFSEWFLQRDMAKFPEKGEYKIRKWLLYLTIFIAAIVIIVDLVTLVYNFLSGELTVRFTLKVLAVGLVSGVVFSYMLWDVRRTSYAPSVTQKRFAWGSSALVLIIIIAGFFLAGSPMTQRKIRLDEQRVSDLINIQSEVVGYWIQKEALPTMLGDLTDSIRGYTAPTDPVTGAPYEYTKTGNLTFQLCATFDAATPIALRTTPGNRGSYYNTYDPYGNNQSWVHEIGRTCFDRTIDPDLYKRDGSPLKPTMY